MRVPTPLRRAAPLALGLAALAATCERYPVTPPYRLTVEPDTLVFTARQGGLPPIARYLTVSGTGPVGWTAEADVPWLGISPTGGGVPQGVLVAPDNRGLSLGTYRGVVSFAAPSAANTPLRAVVQLEIVAQVSLAGRWVAAADAAVVSLDLRDSAGAVTGSGLLIDSRTAVAVVGTEAGGNVALALQPSSGAPVVLNAFFVNDNVLRGSLTGPGFSGDSVFVYRQ